MKISFYIIFLLLGSILNAQDTLNVFFEINESVLNDEHKTKLARSIRSDLNIGVKDVFVDGYADFLGSDSYNQILSLDRANAVRNFLLELGLKKYQIVQIKGYGRQLKGKDDSLGYPFNRRVDVILKDPMTKDSVITFKRIQNINLDSIDLNNLSVGDNIVIKNLNFQGSRHFLIEKSKPVLDALLKIMQDYSSLEIEIQGHICCEKNSYDGYDSDTGDMNLSHNRAKYVYEFMVENGVEASRMSYKGFGRTIPLVKYERTEADRIKNRRVEIKITKK